MSIELDSFLPLVIKPGRYADNELNSVRKGWSDVDVHFLLAFPDTYEIGMSNLGSRILYHVLNSREDTLCERVYAPWVDMEGEMRKRFVPLFSLESRRPASEFDVVGFTLQYELLYTNVLNMLDMAGIPLRSSERTDQNPLVIAGGPCTSNPEPLADVIDAFCIGDGEDVVGELVEVVKAAKQSGCSRQSLLTEVANLEGVYVPQYSFDDKPIRRRMVSELLEDHFPVQHVVPFCEIVHDRLTVEIMRGCSRGCRFCHAGIIYRPVRIRPVDQVLRLCRQGISQTGWEELSLISLSPCDYPHLEPVVERLNWIFQGQGVGISLPSLRGDALTDRLAGALKEVRKSGLTLAPEAGSDRLRRVINKELDEGKVLESVEIAFRNGWNHVKLYFMIGLPTETDQDLQAIVDLVHRIKGRAKGKKLKISLSPFVPKPQTPFQWEAADDLAELRRKSLFISNCLRSRSIQLNWRDPHVSFLETVFARGDRELGAALVRAWELGNRFDEWTEEFDWERWEQAFDETGIDPHTYTGSFEEDAPLPWDHISFVSRSFLKREHQKALRAEASGDCMQGCLGCGSCEGRRRDQSVMPEPVSNSSSSYGRHPRRVAKPLPLSKIRLRVKMAKRQKVRFTSHLDTTRAVLRSIRRADIPVAYSEGFNPRPKVAFGPPLPLGMTSSAEYFDIQLDAPFSGNFASMLEAHLPDAFEILDVWPLYSKVDSLNQSLVAETVSVWLDDAAPDDLHRRIDELLARETIEIVRTKDDTTKVVDIRKGIVNISLHDHNRIQMTLVRGTWGKVRPKEVVREILEIEDRQLIFLMERVEQYMSEGTTLVSPSGGGL
jgi:radical SAM family uncharacterized protein/radical SAM-linked protein